MKAYEISVDMLISRSGQHFPPDTHSVLLYSTDSIHTVLPNFCKICGTFTCKNFEEFCSLFEDFSVELQRSFGRICDSRDSLQKDHMD